MLRKVSKSSLYYMRDHPRPNLVTVLFAELRNCGLRFSILATGAPEAGACLSFKTAADATNGSKKVLKCIMSVMTLWYGVEVEAR
jgi:hypothetical protein